MASIGGAIFSKAGAFTIIENDTVSLTLANTEYPYVLASGVQKIEIRNRNDKLVKMAFVMGDTATSNYWTIYPGEVKLIDNMAGSGMTIYLLSSTASQTIEVIKYK